MTRLYLALLRFYPREYRKLFRAEMRSAFEQAAEERRKFGNGVYLRFLAAELCGLVAGIAPEWIAKWAQRGSYLDACKPTAPEIDESDSAELERQIQLVLRRMEDAIATHQFTKVRFYSEAEKRLRAKLSRLESGSV